MTAERPSSPHTSGADSRCCDCLLPVPAGIGPRCSDCGLFRCSGRELYLMVRYALINHCRVRGGFREQPFDEALTAYSTRVVRARAAMPERSSGSQEPPVSATAPILTRPPRPKVPSGWEAVCSLNDNAYYYWLRRTNHVQWENLISLLWPWPVSSTGRSLLLLPRTRPRTQFRIPHHTPLGCQEQTACLRQPRDHDRPRH